MIKTPTATLMKRRIYVEREREREKRGKKRERERMARGGFTPSISVVGATNNCAACAMPGASLRLSVIPRYSDLEIGFWIRSDKATPYPSLSLATSISLSCLLAYRQKRVRPLPYLAALNFLGDLLGDARSYFVVSLCNIQRRGDRHAGARPGKVRRS